MDEIFKVLVPAVLGLLGTVAGGLLVHRRWKAERADRQQAQYRQERREAYRTLWERLESVHLASRRRNLTDEEFSSVLLDLNSFILKNDVYLANDIHSLANTYAHAVKSFHARVRQSGDDAAVFASADSVTIPLGTIKLAAELSTLGDEADKSRLELKTRVETVLKT